jgi:hypothetical protein
MKILKIFFTTIMWILLLPCVVISQSNVSKAVFSVKSYPETITIGDTIYAVLEVHNPYEKSIEFVDCYQNGLGRWYDGTIQLDVITPDQRVFPLLPEMSVYIIICGPANTIQLQPKETRIIDRYSVTIPPLEDLFGDPHWQKILNNLPSKGEIFKLRVTAALYPHNIRGAKEGEKLIFENKFLLQPRPQNDIKLFKQWYDNTPKKLLPEINTKRHVLPVKIGEAYFEEMNNKLPKEHRYSFFLWCNRYPGYPNLPQDWQGWKKLEESFEPSTLRDGIRWTRIYMQYCTTADEKVLDELKTWLEKMNPIQRTVMVNKYSFISTDIPNSTKLYETIQLFKDKK